MTDPHSERLRSAARRALLAEGARAEERTGWSIEGLDWNDRIEATYDRDGVLESARLVIPRWAWRSEHDRIRELIARFLHAFPSECEARVALACAVADTPSPADEADKDVSGDERERLWDPVEAMRSVIAGTRASAQTARLSVANWTSGEQSRLEIECFVLWRFTIGRWRPDPSIPWAEELWRPHPTDGDGEAAMIRRAVAGACTGDSEPGAAARAVAAARQAVPDQSPLGRFASRGHELLSRWDSGELGTAPALQLLAAELDAGPDTAWPMTLRERNAAVRLLVATDEQADGGAAADAFLFELGPLHADEHARADGDLARYLAYAEDAVERYHQGDLLLEELIECAVDRPIREGMWSQFRVRAR
jgi:hypothetical protein